MNLLNNFAYKKDILKGKVPKEILDEALEMANFCRKYKNSSLSHLRYLNNVGKNKYQCFIPFAQVNESMLLPYLNLCAKKYLEASDIQTSRQDIALKIKNTEYNGVMYDIWVNYCEQGDENKPHYHTDCLLAGILYVTNDNELTYFKNDVKINGNSGDLVIFPGDLLHWTKKQQSQNERVTISFNFSVPMFIFNK